MLGSKESTQSFKMRVHLPCVVSELSGVAASIGMVICARDRVYCLFHSTIYGSALYNIRVIIKSEPSERVSCVRADLDIRHRSHRISEETRTSSWDMPLKANTAVPPKGVWASQSYPFFVDLRAEQHSAADHETVDGPTQCQNSDRRYAMNACLISSIIAASAVLPFLADPKGLCLQLTV